MLKLEFVAFILGCITGAIFVLLIGRGFEQAVKKKRAGRIRYAFVMGGIKRYFICIIPGMRLK